LRELLRRGDVARDERVVIVNTGTGLKYSSLFAAKTSRVPDGAEEIPA
jgi:threonine synthase